MTKSQDPEKKPYRFIVRLIRQTEFNTYFATEVIGDITVDKFITVKTEKDGKVRTIKLNSNAVESVEEMS